MDSGLSATQKTNRTGAVLGFRLGLIFSGEASLFYYQFIHYQFRYESFWLVVDAIPGTMLSLVTNTKRQSEASVILLSILQMFTVHIIDFPVYHWNVLWVNKITGHT